MSNIGMLLLCQSCGQHLLLCPSCSRSRRFCTPCVTQRLIQSHRQANSRYQRSLQGRRKHAKRQANYRQRLQKVTDGSSTQALAIPIDPTVAPTATIEPLEGPCHDQALEGSDAPQPERHSHSGPFTDSRRPAQSPIAASDSPPTSSLDPVRGPRPVERQSPACCCRCGRSLSSFVRLASLRRRAIPRTERSGSLSRRRARPALYFRHG